MKSAFLKNYTSTVPVSETIRRIESVLIRCGVQRITKEYGPSAETAALRFDIPTANGHVASIRLPANVPQALDALWADHVKTSKRNRRHKSDFLEQAERTAWKLMQDWTEVQMSLVAFKQADVVEVFMPYIWNGRETLYQQLKANNFKALPERCE